MCAVNRRISAMLSVTFFLQLIATPLEIYMCQTLQGLASKGTLHRKGYAQKKFLKNLGIGEFV